ESLEPSRFVIRVHQPEVVIDSRRNRFFERAFERWGSFGAILYVLLLQVFQSIPDLFVIKLAQDELAPSPARVRKQRLCNESDRGDGPLDIEENCAGPRHALKQTG